MIYNSSISTRFEHYTKNQQSVTAGRNLQERKMMEQRNILQPSDNSAHIGPLVQTDSFETRLNQYKNNMKAVESSLSLADGYLQEVNHHIREIKVLTLQASNDTMTKEDRLNIAQMVNTHIEAVKDLANSKTPYNSYLFAGASSSSAPFVFSYESGGAIGDNILTSAHYRGAYSNRMVQVTDTRRVPMTFGGFDVFWVEGQKLTLNNFPQNYTAENDSVFYINDAPVQILAGDTVDIILQRINNSLTNVKAERDLVNNALVLQHVGGKDIALFEKEGTVLKDLGLLDPFNAISENVQKDGKSLFDVLFKVRDDIINNNSRVFSSEGLAQLDNSQDAILQSLTRVGAMQEYFDTLVKRGEKEMVGVVEEKLRLDGFDLAQAISRYQQLSQMQDMMYYLGSQLFRSSLLSYLS